MRRPLYDEFESEQVLDWESRVLLLVISLLHSLIMSSASSLAELGKAQSVYASKSCYFALFIHPSALDLVVLQGLCVLIIKITSLWLQKLVTVM